MKEKKKIVAIIPARGGSKGLYKKNIQLLNGKPLIAYPIQAAKDCKFIDRIIVSTDNEEIASIAKKYGAEVPFVRPKKIATDTSAAERVLLHAINYLEKRENYKVDIVVYLQATDVFRQKHFITEVVNWLLKDEKLDSAFVGYPTHKKYWIKKDGIYARVTKRQYITRQKEKNYLIREDTGLACATRANIIKNGERVGDRVRILCNDDPNSGIDIHDKETLEIAEMILKKEEKNNPKKYYY